MKRLSGQYQEPVHAPGAWHGQGAALSRAGSEGFFRAPRLGRKQPNVRGTHDLEVERNLLMSSEKANGN